MLFLNKNNDIFSLIAKYLPSNPIIIEAGAFRGNDSKRLATQFSKGTVHAFEPIPELFNILKESTQGFSNIKCWQYALSNVSAIQSMYLAQKKSSNKITQASSLCKPKERIIRAPHIVFPKKISIQSLSLNDWSKINNIAKVDFMWLDAQGHELAILQGSTDILKKCTALFVELHFIHAYENQPLKNEVIQWLNENNFCMIAKDYLDKPTWFFGNGLFVNKSFL